MICPKHKRQYQYDLLPNEANVCIHCCKEQELLSYQTEIRRNRVGPDKPDNTMVICPACVSQFVAIPVATREELSQLRAENEAGKQVCANALVEIRRLMDEKEALKAENDSLKQMVEFLREKEDSYDIDSRPE